VNIVKTGQHGKPQKDVFMNILYFSCCLIYIPDISNTLEIYGMKDAIISEKVRELKGIEQQIFVPGQDIDMKSPLASLSMEKMSTFGEQLRKILNGLEAVHLVAFQKAVLAKDLGQFLQTINFDQNLPLIRQKVNLHQP